MPKDGIAKAETSSGANNASASNILLLDTVILTEFDVILKVCLVLGFSVLSMNLSKWRKVSRRRLKRRKKLGM